MNNINHIKLIGFLSGMLLLTFLPAHAVQRIIFDDLHGQTYGNADWSPETAFSSFADDLHRYAGAQIDVTSICSTEGIIQRDVLKNCDALIIPEPNLRFLNVEIAAIREFVESGGGLMLICDHGESDRNFDGWDSVLIFNELVTGWGIVFAGNTFSEAPVGGVQQKTKEADQAEFLVGAWAATTIYIEDKTKFHAVISPKTVDGAYIVEGKIQKGRIVAIGDSSPFDDGSGEIEKNRHNSYHSYLYRHAELGVRLVCRLLQKDCKTPPVENLPFPSVESGIIGRNADLVIDAAHGNNDADSMDLFGQDVNQKIGFRVALNLQPFTRKIPGKILVMSNPSAGLTEKEIDHLTHWVLRKGGRLIIAANNAKNPLNAIPIMNNILGRLGCKTRLNTDELLDEKRNTGRPWSLLIERFNPAEKFPGVDKAVFWGCCSLVFESGETVSEVDDLKVLARTSESAVSVIPKTRKKTGLDIPGNSGIPVVVSESPGIGRVIILAANPLTNFQYIQENDKEQIEQAKWDHRTALFNLCLVNLLKQ